MNPKNDLAVDFSTHDQVEPSGWLFCRHGRIPIDLCDWDLVRDAFKLNFKMNRQTYPTASDSFFYSCSIL